MLRASLQLTNTTSVLLIDPAIGTELSKIPLAILVVSSAGNTLVHLALSYFVTSTSRSASFYEGSEEMVRNGGSRNVRRVC
jgi:hypothetical protein